MLRSLLIAIAMVVGILLGACAQGRKAGGTCVTSADCTAGRCLDGVCVAADGGGLPPRDGGGGGGEDGGARDAGIPPRACASNAECDDGNVCTTDECIAGACSNVAMTCDDGDACTDDTCDPTAGCTSAPTSCDDANACTVDSCDPMTGCAHVPMGVMGGSCAAPIDVSAGGTFTGDSTCATNDFTGVCMGAPGPDVAFVLNLATESDVTLDARASSFGGVLFVGATCGDGATACDSDGMPNLTARLPAGRHFVGLDGRASTDVGPFSLTVSATPVVRDQLLTFPQASDTHYDRYSAGYYWNLGDYIEGTRTTSLSSITSADLSLTITMNGLTCDSQTMQLRINGTVVGPVVIGPGATTFMQSYTFGAISGPSYTIRLETTRTVASGCGAAGIADGSTLRIRG